MNIVVIGANRGLGYYLAKVFAENNHQVIAGVFSKDSSPEVNDLQSSYPQNVHLIPMDVSSEESIQAAAQAAQQLFGQVDVLINVAGVLLPGDREGTIVDTDLRELRLSLEVNTVGTVIVMQRFLPVMRGDGGGMMIMVTSEAGSVTNSRACIHTTRSQGRCEQGGVRLPGNGRGSMRHLCHASRPDEYRNGPYLRANRAV